MIIRPSSSQLLQSVRDELKSSVTSAVGENPEILAKLGMIDFILSNVAVRCDHEVAWLREEIADIERSADAVVAAKADRDGHVAAALQALRANRSPSNHIADLYGEYNLASEALSCALEAATRHGGALRKTVEATLAARLAREVEIRGEYALVGRG